MLRTGREKHWGKERRSWKGKRKEEELGIEKISEKMFKK